MPSVPEPIRAFVDVQHASPSFAPPPPTLPSNRVPLHIRGPVDIAIKAAKTAWLIETKRAEFSGEEVSDERLNILYRRGRQWYATLLHGGTPTKVMCVHRETPLPQAASEPCALTCFAHASCNADEDVRECSQKQSFEDRRAPPQKGLRSAARAKLLKSAPGEGQIC